MPSAILIHGPTASGKTKLAIELSNTLGGDIVNADSMQVYSILRVLTARPSDDELASAPHHLFGYVDPARRFSAGDWLKDARTIIADIHSRGRVPIITGGTGLNLMALVSGLSEIPPIPEDSRSEASQLIQQDGVDAAHAKLTEIDPTSAERIKPNDRQRLQRALEVWMATGRTMTDFHKSRMPPVLDDNDWLGVALTPPRSKLYSRIDRRFSSMLMEGAMHEARQLASRDLDPALPAMKAHGMPWLLAYLKGEVTAELAAENAKRDTRRYAKRQFTWIAHQFPFWPRIPSPRIEDRIKVILALYREIDEPAWKRYPEFEK